MKYPYKLTVVQPFDTEHITGDSRYKGIPTHWYIVDLGLPGPRPRPARNGANGLVNAAGEVVTPARLNINEGELLHWDTREAAQAWVDETERLFDDLKPSSQVKPAAKDAK